MIPGSPQETFGLPGPLPHAFRRGPEARWPVRFVVTLVLCAASPWAVKSLQAQGSKASSSAMVGRRAAEVRDDNAPQMKLVWCPPGSFQMEYLADIKFLSTNVTLTRGYWIGKYEVSQAEWKQVMSTEPWKAMRNLKEGPDYPATSVSWTDAMQFCATLTEQERKAGRLAEDWEYTLPTEAQWERACRARTVTMYSFGDDEALLKDFAWFSDNTRKAGESYPHPVGQKKPNDWGLHDMHGNVWEWCRDGFSEAPRGGTDPVGPPDPIRNVFRGGSFNNAPTYCQSTTRMGGGTSGRSPSYGFRVALCASATAPPPSAAESAQFETEGTPGSSRLLWMIAGNVVGLPLLAAGLWVLGRRAPRKP